MTERFMVEIRNLLIVQPDSWPLLRSLHSGGVWLEDLSRFVMINHEQGCFVAIINGMCHFRCNILPTERNCFWNSTKTHLVNCHRSGFPPVNNPFILKTRRFFAPFQMNYSIIWWHAHRARVVCFNHFRFCPKKKQRTKGGINGILHEALYTHRSIKDFFSSN